MASKEPEPSLQEHPEATPNDNSKSTETDKKKLAEDELKKIEEQLQKGKNEHEKTVKEWQNAVNILPVASTEPRETLREVTEKKLPQETLPKASVTRSENLSDHDILIWASGGLAMQGIYQTSDITDLLGKREQLIQIPEGFKLCGPSQGSCLGNMEFSSSKEESSFRKTVEHLGLSFGLASKTDIKACNAETRDNYNRGAESAETSRSSSGHSYICTTQYNYIPLALCHFPREQLKLSSPVLQELREIECLMRHNSDNDNILKNWCESFFKRFGSHVNCRIHFGGIFWRTASSEGFQSNQLEEMKKQTQKAASGHLVGCYISQVGGINAGLSKLDTSSESTDKKSFQTAIQLFVNKTGGPPEVDSLESWKHGLLASNKTWSVIDRGDEFIPVWDIVLSNHKKDFGDVLDVFNTLRESYEALSGRKVNREYGEKLDKVEKVVMAFLEGIKEWKFTTDPDKLVELVNFKKNLYEKIKSEHVWINTCLSNPVLQSFLEHTVLLLEEDLVAPNTSYMRFLLRCLLKPHIYSVPHFPSSSLIMQWISCKGNEQPQAISVTEFVDFISILQQMKTATKSAISTSAAAEGGKVKNLPDLSLVFCSLLKALRDSSQEDLALLLLSIACAAGYDVENNMFQYHLGAPEIGFMLREMQTAHEKYLALLEKDLYRAQAYLILTGLRISVDHKEVPSDEKKKRLSLMTDHMKNLWTNKTSAVLRKHNTCNNWNLLERNLACLIDGNYEATNYDQQKENILRELESILQESHLLKNSESQDAGSNQDKTLSNDQNKEFFNLLKSLELEQYYPNKMKMSDFHLIHKTSVFDRQPSTDQELPCYFLEKILMLDYRARYLACKDGTNLQQGGTKVSDIADNASKHLDDLDYIFEDAYEESHEVFQTTRKPIHPMDIQMAIFYCADDFMRQYIASKLSLCQFALPFLVPIPNTSQIELPLWSFCQVHKQWQEESKLIYQVATPVVSFIRFSASSSSKSQLLNHLLSKQKHNIFSHRYCEGINTHGLLMKGVVEIAWYCPSGKGNDIFDSCIAFTNLHGDSKDHKKQVDFLQEIAAVTVVLLSENDWIGNEDSKTFLRELLKSPKPFIFLCVDKEQILTNRHESRVKIAVKNRNEETLVEELAEEIKSALKISDSCHSLVMCADIARKHGFLVDEDKEECKAGKTMAENIITILNDEHTLREKSTLLPLQGSLWHMWCKKDREQNHLQDHENMGLEQQISQINSAKQTIRQDQLNQMFPFNDLMKSLLTYLCSASPDTKIYFLQWLKTLLANQSSDHLAELQKKYHDLWTQTRSGENSDLHCTLEELSKDISESTFGLEHLLREVSQLFEALDVLPQQNPVVKFLPQIAADLLISGYPIELMDGDASHVPIKWISAVFDTLAEKLGDKGVFVLCVLGSQSTGKSTLLNAMFGLQFGVSPGRCTKGAFMQLVKVSDEFRLRLNFDFLLVVDTEGLQAPKLENRTVLNHDNELATFVIGLGNMTIVNTFGENSSEMQDVLQIAVQAFLRMKQVNLSPSCLFVHQNAGEITREEKNRESQQRLQQDLDNMTVTAAHQESCDVRRFSEVIHFDVNSHFYYFPHLWEGESPMAPPNPTYSQKVQELKIKILTDGQKKSQQGFLTFSELKARIQNLWQALLNETFVFSFRNSLEIAVYSRLENKYSQWTWQLRSFMLDLHHKLNIQIQNGKIHDIDRSFLEESIQSTYEAVQADLEKYFKEDKYSDVMIQWKQNVKIKLDGLTEELIKKTCQNCEKLINLKKRQRSCEQRKSVYTDELLKKSKEVAQCCRDRELNESELREYFNGVWKEWISEVSPPASHINTLNIRTDMERFLFEHFRTEHNIRNKIKESSKWTSFPAEVSRHIFFKKMKNFFQKNKRVSKAPCELTRELERLTCEYIEQKEEDIMNFTSSYFHGLVEIINERIHAFENEYQSQTSSSYRVGISLYLCQMAARKFVEMYKIFQKENDPHFYLNNKKEEFFKTFVISYQGAKSVTTFADFLCGNLQLAIRDAVYEKTAMVIVNRMKSEDPAFNGNRENLDMYLLIHLAENENFEKYMEYIYNPSYSMGEFIRQRVNNYCLDKQNPKLKKFLNSQLDVFKELILRAINDSTKVVEDKGGNVSLWLDEFCSRLGDDLYLPRHTLSNIEHQEVIGIKLIKEAVIDSLLPVLDNLERAFSETDLEPFFVKPHEILFEQFCRCMKQCPFCKALCTNTIPDHDGEHSTYLHRPQAVTGIQWEETNHFVIDICSSIVASDSFFMVDGKKIPCKQYRSAGSDYAKWKIQPNTSSQRYWKWFICHFRNELQNTHQGIFEGKGEIPLEWEDVAIEEVLSPRDTSTFLQSTYTWVEENTWLVLKEKACRS